MNDHQYAKAENSTSGVFESDINYVENMWGEPIPSHLLRIGGVDEWGWASIYHDKSDPANIFTGEYRNANELYVGKLEYRQTDNIPLPKDALGNYLMSYIADGGVYFRAISASQNPKFFQLVPIGKVIYQNTAEAEDYRNSR